MKNIIPFLSGVVLLILIGCSGGSPTNPDVQPTNDLTNRLEDVNNQSNTNLLGYWDFYIDAETGTVELVQDRHAMFTVNLTNILSKQITGLDFEIIKIIFEPDYIDVDIDIIVTHPFAGHPEFNGYDLRGIFMGDGSLTLEHGNLKYPELGVDQYMLPDAIDGAGGPDGYTRWYNFTEFSESDFYLFSYTAGKITSYNFAGTATLCPYKYFADGLQPEEDLWNWLETNKDQNGVFSQGTTNTRNFYVRFPTPEPGLQFSVAVIVSWEGLEPEYHPANCPEAIACEVTDNSDVYYVDPVENGGNLNLNISLFGWDYQPSKIYIESTALSSVYEFTASDMIPFDEGDHYATYHVMIPADNVTGIEGQEYWVIAEYDGFDYTNDFGVPNLTGTDPLSSFFRYDLTVLDYNVGIGWARTWGGSIGVSGRGVATDNLGNVYVTGIFEDTVDFNPNGGDTHTSNGGWDIFLSKFDSAGNFLWVRTWGGIDWLFYKDLVFGIVVGSSGDVYVVGDFYGTVDFDPDGGDPHTANGLRDAYLSKFDTSGNFQWARTWGGIDMEQGFGITLDGSENVYVVGFFAETTDLDPDGGDQHTSNGVNDCFLSKFDFSGNFEWGRTWGGIGGDWSGDVAAEDSGNVFVTGMFSDTVDFDPGGGDSRTSNGESDVFLTTFDSSGNFQWVRTWGGSTWDQGVDVGSDGSGHVYITGVFRETVEFNPGGGDSHTSNGDGDAFLSKFDSSGNFEWARTWGGTMHDSSQDVDVDGSGHVYVTGYFYETVEFNPGGGDAYTSNGMNDGFLSRFDSTGNFKWARTWGGTEKDGGGSVSADDSGYIYVTGWYQDVVDFAPSGPPCFDDPDEHTSNGEWEAFLVKYLPDGCW